jgi:hypothetical protein
VGEFEVAISGGIWVAAGAQGPLSKSLGDLCESFSSLIATKEKLCSYFSKKREQWMSRILKELGVMQASRV